MYFNELESIYLFIASYIICMCFAYKYYKSKRYKERIKSVFYLFLTAAPFSLICAFRSIICGYDTHNYINGFYSGELLPSMDESIEYLYSASRYAALQLFGDHRVFLFIIAAIPIVYFVVSVRKMAKTAGLCALGILLYMLYVSPIMLNQSRQFIAMGISIYALFFLLDNRIKLFILLITIASLCHESALSFLVFPILSNQAMSHNRFLKAGFSIIIIICVFFINHFMQL